MFAFHYCLFFFNAPATTAIYTLSLHDALPILLAAPASACPNCAGTLAGTGLGDGIWWGIVILLRDRKSTRLNSSHVSISYAVFCLKEKENQHNHPSV